VVTEEWSGERDPYADSAHGKIRGCLQAALALYDTAQ
jgi:hypothetical protein